MIEDNIMELGFFNHFTKDEVSGLSQLGEGFEFDWSVALSENINLVGYVYEGDVTGLIKFESVYADRFNMVHLLEVSKFFRNRQIGSKLLAYVAKDSFEKEFQGFMMLETKTVLKRYYIEKLGGQQVGESNIIIFDTVASRKLIDNYL